VSNVIDRTSSLLTSELLERCGARAAGYDRENRFFQEDFDELKAAGYLLSCVPRAFGGAGLNLAELCREQARLAYWAPATAVAVNMHLYWTGIAADLNRAGDHTLDWLLKEAAAGEIFAAGHGERGNDLPVLASSSIAERVDGGYRFTGHKIFGSLTPVWTRLGIHAMDLSDPVNPKVVHAFMPRDTDGVQIVETWDTLGMRATRSDDTVLRGAFVPDRYVVRVVPAGFAGADLFVLGIFAWAEPTFAHIYTAIAQRARDLAVASVREKTSVAMGGRSMAWNPMVQHTVAEMDMELDAVNAQIGNIADAWSKGTDYGGGWPAKLVSAKYRAVEGAKRVVDLAMDVSGGTGMFKKSVLERLYRDVRCGGFHPANGAIAHEIVAKTALGLLGESARW
jgi:alkylation response protein AidB-like acyl-CoA dehydrogenase